MVLRIALASFALAALAGCTSFRDETADRTRLDGDAKGDLGLRLEVFVRGASSELAHGFVEAVRAELEGGDLFEEVEEGRGEPPPLAPASTAHVATPVLAAASRLELTVKRSFLGVVDDFWRQTKGWVVRYELDSLLVDRASARVLEGSLAGIAFDEASDPDAISEAKKVDIAEAAQADAASKIGRALRAAADARAKAAFDALDRIHLPPGVGPVSIAVLGFDDDPAARRRRGLSLARAVAPALGRLGPDLAVVPSEEVEAEVGVEAHENGQHSFMTLKEEDLDRLVPRLGARLFVVGKIEGGGGRIVVRAQVLDTQLRVLGEAQAEAEGAGALKLVATQIARDLGKAIESKPPTDRARRDDE